MKKLACVKIKKATSEDAPKHKRKVFNSWTFRRLKKIVYHFKTKQIFKLIFFGNENYPTMNMGQDE